ncbi:hypothetical protein [Thermoactinomyces mirandus]|uniref:Uncharacterized protein n=1 Tax=Thermoactinomyces mirandus TaxID=2756294 RepID=A0A7W2APU5_9BACL|nr:hypothetical protein [Thermoactinomyces mirandus]MBA4601324.1 hypothetical protein [Thermoactinomyces mirandus]
MIRQAAYTLIAGGVLLFGLRQIMQMRQRNRFQRFIQSMVRMARKNRWLSRIMMEGMTKRFMRRLQVIK